MGSKEPSMTQKNDQQSEIDALLHKAWTACYESGNDEAGEAIAKAQELLQAALSRPSIRAAALEEARQIGFQLIQETNLPENAHNEDAVLNGWAYGITRYMRAIRSLSSQPAQEDRTEEGFYLASFKRGNSGIVTWWGPNNAGYTPYLGQAGIYRKDEIEADYHDSEYTVPVPVSFVRQFEQRLVDSGMSVCGKTFWNAENLRAAIAAAPSDAQKEEGTL